MLTPNSDSYNHATILRSKNPYLISLYSLTQDEKLTTNILYKQILNTFKV